MSAPTTSGSVTLSGVSAHLPVKDTGVSRGLAIKVFESLSERNKGGGLFSYTWLKLGG
jgi:hypothetical protein